MQIAELGLILFLPASLLAQSTGKKAMANEREDDFTISTLRSDYRVQFLFAAKNEITREPVGQFTVEAFSRSGKASAVGSVSGDGVL